MSEPRTEFKIQRRTDGLFSTGGMFPKWAKKGKTWYRPGDVSSHITMATNRTYLAGTYGGYRAEEIDIVTYEITPLETAREPLNSRLNEIDARREAREQLRARANHRAALSRAHAEVQRLSALIEEDTEVE